MTKHHLTKPKWVEILSKKILFILLKKIQHGTLTIHDGKQLHVFKGLSKQPAPIVTLEILHPSAYRKILFDGSAGAGKSYMDGDWRSAQLQGIIELFIINKSSFNKIESVLGNFFSLVRALHLRFKTNTIHRAKNNILAHYDLSNAFFQLILDPTMMYSCALYEPPNLTLHEASLKKIQRICDRLELKPEDHVLEIGTGWGGFAVYAAQKYGCKITTTTISDQQYHFVQAKIKQLGLKKQIKLLNLDYRQLSGQYDKIVSIEMIEAVGYQYFDQFFHQCHQLLKPNGLFFLQTIVINDQAYNAYKNKIDFIKKYIFPGGCLPSVEVICKSVATHTTLQLLSFEDIGKHYVTTLNTWHQQLLSHQQTIMAQGFDERFIRLWEFYFCYCAGGFATHYISDIHALWRKRSL